MLTRRVLLGFTLASISANAFAFWHGTSTPSNGYMSEDGADFYVTEDGTDYYVQE